MRKAIVSIVAVMAVLAVLTSWGASAGALSTPAGRSAGQVINDSKITTVVKAKLLNDNVTRGLAVSVKTFEGRVTLTGAVDNRQERSRAVRIASAVPGVKKVNDFINLKKAGA